MMQNNDRQPDPQHASLGRAELIDEAIQEEGTDLREYARALLHRKWLIAFCTLIAIVLGAIQLRKAEPVYAASATLKYDPGSAPVVSGFEDPAGNGRVVDEIKTQIEVIQSPRMIRRVIDALGLYRTMNVTTESEAKTPLARFASGVKKAGGSIGRMLVSFDEEKLDPELLRTQWQERHLFENLEVKQVRDTKVIEITVYDRRPQQAARIADEFCNQYIQGLLTEKLAAYHEASTFFANQLKDARVRLTESENKIQNYSGNSNMKVLEQNLEIAEKTLTDLSADIEKTKNEIAQFEAEGTAEKTETLLNMLVAKDPKYSSMQQRLNELKIERVRLLANNTADHPDVVRIDKETKVLQTQLTEAMGELQKDSQAKLEITRITLKGLQQRFNDQEEIISRMKKELVEYDIMKGDADSMRELYSALLDRSKKVDLSSEFNPSYVTILSNAKVPEFPNSPRVGRTILLFALFGFTLGASLVLIVHKFDRSIKEPRIVESRLGLPTLGTVPHLRTSQKVFQRKGARPALVTDFDPKSLQAESYRVLRTSLQYSSAGRPPQVLLVSSCLPQEGKSTVAVNLALSFSQRGDRVLFIDADLKMPSTHRIFERPRVPGLSDVLAGQQGLDAVIVGNVFPNLDYIPAGPNVPCPGDLLESRTMGDTLADLRRRYDIIIVDSAPLGGMADTIVLSRMVDGLCLVVNRGKTPMDALTKVVGTLDRVQAHVLGVIYNSRHRTAPQAGDPGSYGYGYGYGYGAKAEEKA
ncbi:polysaccharide biosynthesis tyrosine autokinase [Candidatus Sumerlaeota bacterium]|nr:polysaccharide biosynthesis tyrosine autokinase [Candidatus Sumerlaeota bacterium]